MLGYIHLRICLTKLTHHFVSLPSTNFENLSIPTILAIKTITALHILIITTKNANNKNKPHTPSIVISMIITSCSIGWFFSAHKQKRWLAVGYWVKRGITQNFVYARGISILANTSGKRNNQRLLKELFLLSLFYNKIISTSF